MLPSQYDFVRSRGFQDLATGENRYCQGDYILELGFLSFGSTRLIRVVVIGDVIRPTIIPHLKTLNIRQTSKWREMENNTETKIPGRVWLVPD